MDGSLEDAEFPESQLWGLNFSHTASSNGYTSNNSNREQSITWQTLNGLHLVSLVPAEDEDPLLTVTWAGDVKEVRSIITAEEHQRNLILPNKDRWTPLHEAAYYGRTECLKILLEAVPDKVNCQTRKGQTPLILAVSRGHLGCVEELLKKGADPCISTITNETPLYEACATCNAQIVLVLLRNGADANQKCFDGWTALHETASRDNKDICEILVGYGANVNISNVYGVTPVFLTAQCGCFHALQFLVEKGSDINSEAKDGATALYEACKQDHEEIVEFLLSYNADANRPGKDGLLPLHFSAKCGNYRTISILIPVTSRTKIHHSGISPLHLAAENDEDEALELLIQAGFNVNALLVPERSRMYEDRRISALYFAVDNGNIDAATMLLKAGADPNLDPFNPLMLAVRRGQIKMATLLLAHGADINASIPTHLTSFPACVMLSVRNLTLLKCLMDHGCDAEACFYCIYGSKKHSTVVTALSHRSQIERRSCLQFCEMVTHPSVCHWAGAILNLLLDYVDHVKLCSRLREHLESHDIWPNVKEKLMLPQSLMQLCRLEIRKLVGKKRLKCISMLDLPGRLIRYLNHDQQDDTLRTM
ncbi:ankyrin repeat and SOCS box protein 2-like [Trichomycterus rosablanca]|uniref:ankyrin repeat and SOCS box protein 2-like n=1 Tax=Trichomycterus rosablanca TaxID=2290929 RepID=UPI002F360505